MDFIQFRRLYGYNILVYTRYWTILNKSWRQHRTSHQLYGHLPGITKTIQVRLARHAGHCWRSRENSLVMYSYGPPYIAKQKQDDQHEHTYSSYVRIRDVALKTCQKRWMIGRSGERGSGISVLAARHDDDDDDGYKNATRRRQCNVMGWIYRPNNYWII